MVLLSRNCYEYGVNTFGAVLAGAVLVTMNQKKTWDELSWELELAEPALIPVSYTHLDVYKRQAEKGSPFCGRAAGGCWSVPWDKAPFTILLAV